MLTFPRFYILCVYKHKLTNLGSLQDDYAAGMRWLDSTYPETSTAPGAERGTCPITSGVPSEVEAKYPNSNVIFSNIKFGTIGSTYK